METTIGGEKRRIRAKWQHNLFLVQGINTVWKFCQIKVLKGGKNS